MATDRTVFPKITLRRKKHFGDFEEFEINGVAMFTNGVSIALGGELKNKNRALVTVTFSVHLNDLNIEDVAE